MRAGINMRLLHVTACIEWRRRGCDRSSRSRRSASAAWRCTETRSGIDDQPTSPKGENDVEKCVACQYYDRNDSHSENKGTGWGKCRRSVPIVHPVSAKAYMVEGIWPHVRDDDWCGEWTASKRRDAAHPDARNLMLQPPVQSPLRTGALPPGALMAAPVASAPDMPASPRTSFGSD